MGVLKIHQTLNNFNDRREKFHIFRERKTEDGICVLLLITYSGTSKKFEINVIVSYFFILFEPIFNEIPNQILSGALLR